MALPKRGLCVTMLLCAATSALAEGGSNKQVDLKQTMVEQCVTEGKQMKIAAGKDLQTLCQCTVDVQAKELLLGEYWQIHSAMASGSNPASIAALKRIQPKLNACSKNLTLNTPTVK